MFRRNPSGKYSVILTCTPTFTPYYYDFILESSIFHHIFTSILAYMHHSKLQNDIASTMSCQVVSQRFTVFFITNHWLVPLLQITSHLGIADCLDETSHQTESTSEESSQRI
eukprot:Sdes_comp20944_c0_seq3m18491